MSSFVESATLRLVDETSANAAKINKSLDKLWKTASKLSSLNKSIDLNIKTSKLDLATKKLTLLRHDLAAVKSESLNIRANTNSLDAALRKVERLRREAGTGVNFDVRGHTAIDEGRVRASADYFGNIVGTIVGNAIYNAGAKLVDKTAQAVMTADDAQGYGKALFSVMSDNKKIAEAGNRKLTALESLAKSDSTRPGSLVNEGQRLYNLIDAQTNIPPGADPYSYFKTVSRRMDMATKVFGLVDRDMASAAESTKTLERALSAIDRQGSSAADRAVFEGILKTKLQSGEGLKPDTIVNMMQQFQGLAKGFDANAIADALNIREEGGRQSTASFRQLITEATKGSIGELTKEGEIKGLGITKGALEKQISLGWRDATTGMTLKPVADAFGKNFFDATEKYIAPLVKLTGKETTAEIASRVQQATGFTQEGSKAAADVLFSRQRVLQQRREREGIDLNSVMKVETLRTSISKLDAAFSTLAQKAITPMVPTIQAGVDEFAGQLQRLSAGTSTTEDLLKMTRTGALLGTTASLAGLATGDAATRPLFLAGAALSSSAGLLSSAALLLMGDKAPKTPAQKAAEEKADFKKTLADLDAKLDPKNFTVGTNEAALESIRKERENLIAGQVKRDQDHVFNTIEGAMSDTRKRTAAILEQEQMFRAAQFERYGRELDPAVMQSSTALQAFSTSLYNTSNAANSYADQLRKVQEAEGLKVTGKRDKATEAFKQSVIDAADKAAGLKSDKKFGKDNLETLGFSSVADMQRALGVPADGIFGPVTAEALKTSELLAKLNANLDQNNTAAKTQTDIQNKTTGQIKGKVTGTGTVGGTAALEASGKVVINAPSVEMPPATNIEFEIARRKQIQAGGPDVTQMQAGADITRLFQQASSTVGQFIAGSAADIGQTIMSGASTIEATITSGQAGIQAAIASGAETLGGGIVSGSQQAAGILASAISGAAANVRVQVNQSTPAAKPLNTGGQRLGPV